MITIIKVKIKSRQNGMNRRHVSTEALPVVLKIPAYIQTFGGLSSQVREQNYTFITEEFIIIGKQEFMFSILFCNIV